VQSASRTTHQLQPTRCRIKLCRGFYTTHVGAVAKLGQGEASSDFHVHGGAVVLLVVKLRAKVLDGAT